MITPSRVQVKSVGGPPLVSHVRAKVRGSENKLNDEDKRDILLVVMAPTIGQQTHR